MAAIGNEAACRNRLKKPELGPRGKDLYFHSKRLSGRAFLLRSEVDLGGKYMAVFQGVYPAACPERGPVVPIRVERFDLGAIVTQWFWLR